MRKEDSPRRLAVAAVVVFAGLVLCGCDSPSKPSQSFTIAKAWWPAWDTFQIGVRQRESLERSFQTTFLHTDDYVPALRAFEEGNADAATLTIYEALLAASKGIPLKIVLLLDYTTGSDGVVAKNTIRALHELKGKRIGVGRGTIAHFTVIKALEKAGLDETEVQLVDLELEALKEAFLNDEVDAIGVYEPYMSDLARRGNGYIIFSSREIPRAICDVLFVKDSVVRDHPDLIHHWIEAWNDALNFKANDPDGYLGALNRLNGTPMRRIEESLGGIFLTNLAENRRAFGIPSSRGYLFDSLKEMETFLLDHGVIQQRLALEDLIYSAGVARFFER